MYIYIYIEREREIYTLPTAIQIFLKRRVASPADSWPDPEEGVLISAVGLDIEEAATPPNAGAR